MLITAHTKPDNHMHKTQKWVPPRGRFPPGEVVEKKNRSRPRRDFPPGVCAFRKRKDPPVGGKTAGMTVLFISWYENMEPYPYLQKNTTGGESRVQPELYSKSYRSTQGLGVPQCPKIPEVSKIWSTTQSQIPNLSKMTRLYSASTFGACGHVLSTQQKGGIMV